MYRILLYSIGAILVLGLSVFALSGLNTTPCYAYDSANVTSVDLNLTNPELTQIVFTLEEVEETIDDLNANTGYILLFLSIILVLLFVALALWQKNNVFLYALAAVFTIGTGIEWLSTSVIIGWCIIGLAGYMVYEAIMNAFFGRNKGIRKKEGG